MSQNQDNPSFQKEFPIHEIPIDIKYLGLIIKYFKKKFKFKLNVQNIHQFHFYCLRQLQACYQTHIS